VSRAQKCAAAMRLRGSVSFARKCSRGFAVSALLGSMIIVLALAQSTNVSVAQSKAQPFYSDSTAPSPQVIFGPIASPVDAPDNTTPTETVDVAAPSSSSGPATEIVRIQGGTRPSSSLGARTRPHVRPRSTNENAQCGLNAPLATVDGSLDFICMQGEGTYTYGLSSQNALLTLTNNTGSRVWFHQDAGGGGWADCFDRGNGYELSGRDMDPGNIQITNNNDQCTSTPGGNVCSVYGAMAFTTGGPSTCYYSAITYISLTGTPFFYLMNASGYRVWLHEDPNNNGWADCFTNNNAYELYGTQDEFPGNLQVTSNSDDC
jgi:hypothetical protein